MQFEKQNDNKDDVDGYVATSSFLYAARAVTVKGRRLRISDCSFAKSNTCITLEWFPQNNDPNPNNFQLLPYGMRAYWCFGNRVHSCQTFIDNTKTHSEELRGLVVGQNLLDIGGVLFKGSARHSTFSNNCVTNTNKTPILITKWFEANTITGNVFSGQDSEYSSRFGILAERHVEHSSTIRFQTTRSVGFAETELGSQPKAKSSTRSSETRSRTLGGRTPRSEHRSALLATT